MFGLLIGGEALIVIVPKLVKNIQRFLGLANYYRRFVKGFVKIVML